MPAREKSRQVLEANPGLPRTFDDTGFEEGAGEQEKKKDCRFQGG